MNILLWLTICILILVIVNFILKSNYIKGKKGEAIVSFINKTKLNKQTYKILNNITIKLEDGTTTQIDHIIISKFGIFVIETKNMKGLISGSEKQFKWTQNIFGKEYQFQNPLRQNYKHIKAIAEILGIKRGINSIIVFIGECKFKTKMPKNVFDRSDYIYYIKSFYKPIFTTSEVENIYFNLKNKSLKNGFITDLKHKHSLRDYHSYKNLIFCKRCGNRMVIRVNKKTNTKFLGCSNYPKCKYTQNIIKKLC